MAIQRLSNAGQSGYRYKSLIAGITPVASVPAIGTATALTFSTASVTFTAPGVYGAATFTATSSPGGLTGTSATSPITVSGLSEQTAYTFTVTATNPTGTSSPSAASNSITTPSAFTPESGYDSLATVKVPSGGAASIEFAGIPSGYKHLQIRGIGYASGAGANWYDAFMQFNGNTSSVYDYHALEGDGSSASATASLNRSNMIVGYFGGTNVSGMIVDVLDYANISKNKTVKALTGLNQNNSNDRGILLVSNLYRSTVAVNSIKIFPSSGTISQHTSFALYGIK